MTQEEIKEIIRKGETTKIQFKQTFRTAEDIANEMVAFSNSKGGVIIVGISDKTGEITGLEYEEIQKLGSMVGNAANDRMRPAIYPEVDTMEIDGKKIMIIKIEKGFQAPYKNYRGEIYVKQGPDKRRVTDNHELLRLFYDANAFQPDREKVEGTSIRDIDMIRLDEFFKKYYHISVHDIDMPLEKALENLSIIDENGKLTMAGLMFFGKTPRFKYEWFMIKAVWFYGDSIGETEYRDSRDFVGTIPYMYEKGMDFLDSVLHHVQGGQDFNSVGILEIPEVALKEILQNALIHRSWLNPAPIRLLVFSDRVEIISPGSLPNNLTVEDIKMGNAFQRNQLAATLCAKTMDYRGLGSGIVRALRADSDIEFHNEESGDQFRVILWRKRRHEYADRVEEGAVEYGKTLYKTYEPTRKLSSKEKVLTEIRTDNKVSIAAMAARLGMSMSGIQRCLQVLKDAKVVRRVGPDKGGHWEIIGDL